MEQFKVNIVNSNAKEKGIDHKKSADVSQAEECCHLLHDVLYKSNKRLPWATFLRCFPAFGHVWFLESVGYHTDNS
jgi:hypothetical protein